MSDTKVIKVPGGMVEADSLDDLKADTGNKNVYLDRTKGIVYGKFTETDVRTEVDKTDCIGGMSQSSDGCPNLTINMKKMTDVDLTDGDCTKR